jgi:hypothetical protein
MTFSWIPLNIVILVGEQGVAQSMMRLHPAIQRLRPSRKDWNDVPRLRA